MFLQSSGSVSAKAGGVHIVVTKIYRYVQKHDDLDLQREGKKTLESERGG